MHLVQFVVIFFVIYGNFTQSINDDDDVKRPKDLKNITNLHQKYTNLTTKYEPVPWNIRKRRYEKGAIAVFTCAGLILVIRFLYFLLH